MRRMIAASALALLAVAGCGSDASTDDEAVGSGGGDALTVIAEDFRFEPASLPLDAGQTVHLTVTNGGGAEHNFTLEEADVSEDVEPGEDADVTFTAPDANGTYTYYCEYHRGRGMAGTITVTGGAAGSEPGGSSTSGDDGY